MSENNKSFLFSTLFLFLITPLFSQKGIHKFGNIPMEEMEMTVYEPDSSATAVVLLNTGHYRVRDYKFNVHKRIKILKQAGTSYGNITLRVRSKGAIKASCFNLENGVIVEYKLKRSEMIEEEITDDLIVYKLLLPNVKVGSVVEVNYEFNGLPFEWNFQELIPVKYNELLVEKSQYIIFELSHYGRLNLKNLGGYHWVGKELPAFKPEPFMTSINNNIRRVEFELERIEIPGVYYKEYSTTWDMVSKSLLDFASFGALLRTGTPYLNEKAGELKKMEVPEGEKIELAYDYIRDNIKWNGNDGIYASREYRRNFTKDHSGNVAEINLSLVSLLNKSKIEAYPVVLSTKKHGYLKKYKPTIDKLNYVICLARVDWQDILLDAASENTSIGVLPPKCLNGDGWLVKKGEQDYTGWGEWVKLEPKDMTFERSYAQIDIESDGSVVATLLKKQNLFDYLKWKEVYDDFGSDEKYHRYLDEKYGDIEVIEYSSDINEEKMSVKETIKLDLASQMEDFGNELILNPFVFSIGLENRFKSDERLSPVDMGYKYGLDRNISVKLPPGISAGKLPEHIQVATDDGKAQFVFQSFKNENSMTVKYTMMVKDPIIYQADYPLFKAFYSLMIDKLNESISLKKT